MQNPETGQMKAITYNQFMEALNGGRNVVTVGDVFRIRRCYFEVENISDYGISAKGITRSEFFDQRRKQRINKESIKNQ